MLSGFVRKLGRFFVRKYGSKVKVRSVMTQKDQILDDCLMEYQQGSFMSYANLFNYGAVYKATVDLMRSLDLDEVT